MIDKITVDKIYEAANILDVVSDFVTLKRRGVNFVGLCPFHDDSSPSFYVSPAKNICKCFACGEGGTSVQFIMKHEQVTYNEALHYLAKKFNIEIKERELTESEKQLSGDRESMLMLNSWAQKFFTSRLFEHEEGIKIGYPYFAERGFRSDIIKKFQLGYSSSRRDDLYKNAVKQGFKDSYLLKTGLVYQREDGSFSDRFYGRVIFPVHSISGKIVAFGGRILGKKDKVAKYVNSPESEIYHKSSELYGLFFAKQAIVKADRCYLVEGYTDVISMHQSGIENVVASSGTSLTHGQIRLIHRFTSNITVLYDGDSAGIKAAIRGIDMFLEEGMNVKVVLLPEGEDPDSFSRSCNAFDFNLFMKEHEVDFIRFKTDLLMKEADKDPIKKVALIRDIMNSISVIPDSIMRSVYIKECSNLLDEREQVLIDEVIKIRNNRKKNIPPHINPVPKPDSEENIEIEIQEQGVGDNANNETVDNKEAGLTEKPERLSPYKKYETPLIGYVIRYGERELFKEKDEPGINAAQYILSELQNDNLEIQTSIYRQILEEAVANSENDGFTASQYFLSHNNLEISKIAANLLSSKYQLSKYFEKKDDSIMQKISVSEEELSKEIEKRRIEKQREEIEKWVYHDLFALKNAHFKGRIDEINKLLKIEQDEEKKMKLLKERIELDKIKQYISKVLGERIITGVGS